jgi:type II secretory pathway pseudopilin PulG
MNVDSQHPVETPGLSCFRPSERGFSALELVVIIAIVSVVIAIGVPTLHSRAKASVLGANLQSLGSVVNTCVMEGYSSEYRPSGQGDPQDYLSSQLEQVLSTAGKAGYANPFVGAGAGRLVLNSRVIPTGPQSLPPAVLITDSSQYQYLTFDAQPEATRRLLVGTLIIAFNPGARSVDVFYVGGGGRKSASVVNVPTA